MKYTDLTDPLQRPCPLPMKAFRRHEFNALIWKVKIQWNLKRRPALVRSSSALTHRALWISIPDLTNVMSSWWWRASILSGREIQVITHTPWKINMERTNHPFKKENDLPNLQGIRFHVNLQGCTMLHKNHHRQAIPQSLGRGSWLDRDGDVWRSEWVVKKYLKDLSKRGSYSQLWYFSKGPIIKPAKW